MSPSHMLSRGNSPRMRAIQGMSVARWMGIATACASVSPESVNRLAEASSPSFTMGEKELLSSVNSISLAMPAGREQRGGVFLLDDGWTGKMRADLQRGAVVDPGGNRARPTWQSNLRLAHQGRPARGHP